MRIRKRAGVAVSLATVISVAVVAAASGESAVRAGATTVATPTTARPTTTVAATTTTPPSLPPPADEASDPVRALVPSIVAVEDELATVTERQPVVAAALTEASNAIAVETPTRTLCAVVPVGAPLMAAGRWEHDGETLATADLTRRDPPGYGDCVSTDESDGFDDGVYQYLAIGETGATSAAATVVLGAPSVAVWLLNNGDEPACLVQTSPRDADFYESHQSDSELLPGEALAVRLADVAHNVRVFGCPPGDVERSFDLEPEAGVYVDLFTGEEPAESTPGVTATSTTVRPTTTG
jgi:hypothetical protein